MGTSPCSKGVKDKCASAAGSTVVPFLLRHHSLMRERGGAFLPARLHYDLSKAPGKGKLKREVNNKIQRECFGRAVVTMSVPSGYVCATESPQRVALADLVLQQPQGNVLLEPWPHQPTLQPHVKVTTRLVTKPCLYCCSRGLHCQHCFIARHWAEDVQVQHHLSNTQQLSIDGSLFTETL